MTELRKALLAALLVLFTLLLAGCEPAVKEKLKVCSGLPTAGRAIERLKTSAAGLESFRVSNGKCHARFYENGKKHNERFGVKLWVNPPNEIRLQGDIFLNPKGLDLGANDRQFWFSVKPELNSYVWGNWDEQENPKALLINPATMLEAFGAIEMDIDGQWDLANEGPFDVLSLRAGSGRLLKRIYVYCCDSTVRKIVYFDKKAVPAVICELDEYVQVAEGFSLPSGIKLITFNEKGDEEFFDITFKSIKPYSFSDKQKKAIFEKPSDRGFKKVYRLAHGELIEQPK